MKRNFFQSTIFRIVAVIIALVLPINILTLVLSNMVLQENQRQLVAETQNALEMKVGTFEDVLNRVNKRLTFMSFDETSILALSGDNETLSRSQLSANLVNAREQLKKVRQEYQWIDQQLFMQFR